MGSMKLTSQDSKIISCILHNGSLSAYGISHITGISIPQATYRLNKLYKSGVISPDTVEHKTVYSIHSTLQSTDVLTKIVEHLQSIVYLINDTDELSPEGTKAIICYILDIANISEYKSYEEDK